MMNGYSFLAVSWKRMHQGKNDKMKGIVNEPAAMRKMMQALLFAFTNLKEYYCNLQDYFCYN
jgi:hypothetical protein